MAGAEIDDGLRECPVADAAGAGIVPEHGGSDRSRAVVGVLGTCRPGTP